VSGNVGDSVRVGDTERDGAIVGDRVGVTEGLDVGKEEGTPVVGVMVGFRVMVGLEEGVRVGKVEGIMEGDREGVVEGVKEGGVEGVVEGCVVGKGVTVGEFVEGDAEGASVTRSFFNCR